MLTKYTDKIDSMYKSGEISEKSVQQFLTDLANTQNSINVLKTWIDNPSWLENSAKYSYEHALGFDKLVLGSSNKHGYKLRLHVWWPEKVSAGFTENIHSHRWDFGSAMIVGSYIQELFVQDNTSSLEFLQYKCFPPKGKDYYSMEKVGTVGIKKVFEGSVSAGDFYYLRTDAIHRVYKPQNDTTLTATFILQTAPKTDYSLAFSPNIINDSNKQPSVHLSTKQLKNKLSTLLDRLQG